MFHPSSEVFTGCRPKHVMSITITIPYKLSTLCHPFFSHASPATFLSSSCVHYIKTAPLHFWLENCTFHMLRPTCLDICSFSCAALSAWNSLPLKIRHIQSTTAFQIALKTYLSFCLKPTTDILNYVSWLTCCACGYRLCVCVCVCGCTYMSKCVLM